MCPTILEVDGSKLTAKLARIPVLFGRPYAVQMEPHLVVAVLLAVTRVLLRAGAIAPATGGG